MPHRLFDRHAYRPFLAKIDASKYFNMYGQLWRNGSAKNDV